MDNMMHNMVVWFDIPVTQLERAKKFYGTVFGIKFQEKVEGDRKAALFPYTKGMTSGALVHGPDCKPTPDGSMVYLNGGNDLALPLAKVEAAGGKLLMPKTPIGNECGFIAFFQDSEGNRVGLYSPN